MQGYMTILSEAWEIGQFDNPNNCPTHVFLQVGVGSFSGGMSGFLVNQMKRLNANIKIIVVEPREADCVYRSHQKGDIYGKLENVAGRKDIPMTYICIMDFLSFFYFSD